MISAPPALSIILWISNSFYQILLFEIPWMHWKLTDPSLLGENLRKTCPLLLMLGEVKSMSQPTGQRHGKGYGEETWGEGRESEKVGGRERQRGREGRAEWGGGIKKKKWLNVHPNWSFAQSKSVFSNLPVFKYGPTQTYLISRLGEETPTQEMLLNIAMHPYTVCQITEESLLVLQHNLMQG